MSAGRLSASGLRRVELCPASASLPKVGRLYADAAAGTEAHAIREAQEARPGYSAEVAFAYNAITGESRELGHLTSHRAYPDLGEGWIYGQVDTIGETPEEGLVIEDYKSGGGYDARSGPLDGNLQLGYYAMVAALARGRDGATVRIVRADGPVSELELDAMALMAVEARIRTIYERASAPEPEIVESDEACWRCPCYARCPAKTALAMAYSEGLAPKQWPTVALSDESVARGWWKLKQAKRLLGEVEAALRAYAADHDVPLGDGQALGVVIKERREIDADVAYAVLAGEYAQDVALAGVQMKTSQAAIKRALEQVADKGAGAAALRRVLSLVEQAGGISVEETRSVQEKKQ